jgi:hypothetical protein
LCSTTSTHGGGDGSREGAQLVTTHIAKGTEPRFESQLNHLCDRDQPLVQIDLPKVQ